MLQPKVYIKSLDLVLPVEEINFDINVVEVSLDNSIGFAQFDFDEVEFMENTGLKDVNGKYVYTGDIVEVENWGCGAVIYKKNAYTYMTKAIDEDWCLSIYGCLSDTKSVKVVGNIYENKDLLGVR